jgi:hypothetical protein
VFLLVLLLLILLLFLLILSAFLSFRYLFLKAAVGVWAGSLRPLHPTPGDSMVSAIGFGCSSNCCTQKKTGIDPG